MLPFATCGYLKSLSVNTRLYAVFSATFAGRYALISGLNANGIVDENDLNCTPLLLAWLLIHTNGGGPENIPPPPRTCKLLSPSTSQLKPILGENSGLLPGALPIL